MNEQPTPPDIAALSKRVQELGAALQAQSAKLQRLPVLAPDVSFNEPGADRQPASLRVRRALARLLRGRRHEPAGT